MNREAMLQWWLQREPRERSALAAAAAVALIALIYLVLIDPAASASERLRRSLPALRAQAAQLDGLLAEVRALRAKPAVAGATGPDTPSALEHSLAASGLKAARIVPLANGAMQLTFTNVRYAAWSVWLASAERDLGLHAVTVAVHGTQVPGNADIELALRSGQD